jgi:AraC-like DNA-binding protein
VGNAASPVRDSLKYDEECYATPMKDQAKFWEAPDLGGLQLLSATFVTHSFPRHFHDTYVICVHEKGAEEFYCRGATRVSPVGSLVTLDPGEVHTGHPHDHQPWVFRCFYPDPSLMQSIASQLPIRRQTAPHFRAPIVFDPELAKSLGRLHRTLETSSDTLHRETALIVTLGELITRHSTGSCALRAVGSETQAVKTVRDYIEEHYVKNPSLKELANLAGLSPFYLLRAFRKEMGLPPHEFLTQVRVARAMKLLARGLPIAQVALETGFVDQSHLTKRFKRIVGVTPKQFAEGLRTA